jgi:hypothetical protein
MDRKENHEGLFTMTDNDTKRAAIALFRRGLITRAEMAQLAGITRQLARHWAKDYPNARDEYLARLWAKALSKWQ